MPPMPPLPWRLIRLALVLTFIGLLPSILALFLLEAPNPARLLDLLLVPPHVQYWLADYVVYKTALFVGVVLLALAAILVLRKVLQGRSGDLPVSTSRVLLDEADTIHEPKAGEDLWQAAESFRVRSDKEHKVGRDGLKDVSPRVYRWLLDQVEPRGRTALCISGGGIRSASFGLGVLQALAAYPRLYASEEERARKSLLAQFNYLSTVSGGGYIGGWFSAWVHRAGYQKVWADLVRIAGRDQDPGEQAPPLRWLRVHSNFLTPTLGLSGDTMAGVAIVLRNLFLNWLILLPALCAVLLTMKLIALWVFFEWQQDWKTDWWIPLLLWLVLLIAGLTFTLSNRPSRTHGQTDRASQATEADFITWGLLPAGLAAIFFTLFLAIGIVHRDAYRQQLIAMDIPLLRLLLEPSRYSFLAAAFLGATIYSFSYSLSWIGSWPAVARRLWGRMRPADQNGGAKVTSSLTGSFWRWALSGAVYGALVLAITHLFLSSSEIIERLIFVDILNGTTTGVAVPRRLLALLYLGVPLMLLAQLLAEMIFVGLTSEEEYSDEDREWLGRAAGLALLAGVAWLVIFHLAYISTDIVIRAGAFFSEHPGPSIVMIVALYLIAAIAAAVARSGRTPVHLDPQADRKAKAASKTLSIIAVILLVVLVVGISALIDALVLGDSIAECAHDNAKCLGASTNFWLVLVVVLLVGVISSRNININRFSLHALYRNRLIRMFLGASNQEKRQANPFTDFDQEDNLAMHTLWPATRTGWRPFHIVNIALNVSSSQQHLEWQERKAASFTVSPLHCGSAATGFRPSNAYGDKISLGTAIAISGAAASPNQGYISSAPLAFLMAIFNVRLGWWLGNPGRSGEATHKYDGPKNALVPFFSEMLGMTSDTNKYVYLSDGGHFENLALYEMVRRRCRFIVLSDAGCDPDFEFEDLGNAVRKIQIDLGVPIHFYGLDKLKARRTPSRIDTLLGGQHPSPVHDAEPLYHAIGLIDYAAADGVGEVESEKVQGIILYIKPAYLGTEVSAGVRGYALANPDFPHESTGDQFFGESQMESYRALGFEIMDTLLHRTLKEIGGTDQSLQSILTALAKDVDPLAKSATAASRAS